MSRHYDQRIHAAKAFQHLTKHPAGFNLFRQICANDDGIHGSQLPFESLHVGAVPSIMQDKLRAFLSKPQRYRGTDRARGAGDHDNFAGEICLHERK